MKTSASAKSATSKTGFPFKVNTFRTAPVSSFTRLVRSARIVSKDLVFLEEN